MYVLFSLIKFYVFSTLIINFCLNQEEFGGQVTFNCRPTNPALRLPNTSSVSFRGTSLTGGDILNRCPDLMASTRAACHGSGKPSGSEQFQNNIDDKRMINWLFSLSRNSDSIWSKFRRRTYSNSSQHRSRHDCRTNTSSSPNAAQSIVSILSLPNKNKTIFKFTLGNFYLVVKSHQLQFGLI